MANFLTRIFGSRNQRLLRQYSKIVDVINDLEPAMQALDDAELKARTGELRDRAAKGETLDELLPEAFAVVREASQRTIGLRPFDVQLIGGIVLHEGKIAEMRTGEGKTLVATLPAYLNTLGGNAVHIVTVNEYLAQRDADWMGPIYEFLGLKVGVSKSGQTQDEKRAAYDADITYATNNELGFDYLRDNLAFSLNDKVQRDLTFAIVDEVDSILIDEARTPLIISGPVEESTDLYQKINKLIPKLRPHEEPEGPVNHDIAAREVALVDEKGKPVSPAGGANGNIVSLEEAIAHADDHGADLVLLDGDAKVPVCQLATRGHYSADEKAKQVHVTEEGHQYVEQLMIQAGLLGEGESLYDAANIRLLHHLNAALRAHVMFHKDVEYIVKDGEIVIVDEFTGRTMAGRRWSDGLHQAIEAKEGVAIKQENQTVASITFQNYFRLYKNLSGMTGTADTEAFEFQQIYGLEVVVIPTHQPMNRDDAPDLVYLTQKDKFDAIVEDISDCRERGQPVLVGTTSIETSEFLSNILKKKSIKHEVLNAKHHAREAIVVQQAGRPGAITIATNMAGRGTDIVLGGNLEAELAAAEDADKDKIREDWQKRHDEVIKAGGLHIIGTERHESRRIDNQLRGRSGRQGDPGSSRFYLSMEDNLMRIFGDPQRTKRLLSRAGMREGEAIESPLLSRQIERAQRKVESHNFDIRKNLLEYDDVANDQRKVVYHQRTELMAAEEIEESVSAIRDEAIESLVNQYIPPGSLEEQWDPEGLAHAFESDFATQVNVPQWIRDDPKLNEEQIRERYVRTMRENYEAKVASIGASLMRLVEKEVMLKQLDFHWKEHLAAMDYLRQGIGLRGYAQKNPKQEYKREAFEMFGQMLDQVKYDTISILSRVRIQSEQDVQRMEAERRRAQAMEFRHAAAPPLAGAQRDAAATPQQMAAPPPAPEPFVREGRKIGRNEPCPCGSGKKYKQCHGRLD